MFWNFPKCTKSEQSLSLTVNMKCFEITIFIPSYKKCLY